MSVQKLFSVAQVSAKLHCARSTVRKLIAEGELRASRIRSRTIRISETDLLVYLDGRTNVSASAVASPKRGQPMTNDRLTAILAERVMGWRVSPERFLKGGRSWTQRWQFQPLRRLDHAFQLLEKVNGTYTLARAGDGTYTAQVCVGDRRGTAVGESEAAAVTVALARAVGIAVEGID